MFRLQTDSSLCKPFVIRTVSQLHHEIWVFFGLLQLLLLGHPYWDKYSDASTWFHLIHEPPQLPRVKSARSDGCSFSFVCEKKQGPRLNGFKGPKWLALVVSSADPTLGPDWARRPRAAQPEVDSGRIEEVLSPVVPFNACAGFAKWWTLCCLIEGKPKRTSTGLGAHDFEKHSFAGFGMNRSHAACIYLSLRSDVPQKTSGFWPLLGPSALRLGCLGVQAC